MTATIERVATETPSEVDWLAALQAAVSMPGSVGNVYSRFYSYSYLNCLLLMMQHATEPVATYKRWQGMSRQVRKGERALYIVRPITCKREDKVTGEVATFQRFKPVRCLFQVGQTDGAELPPAPALPEWSEARALDVLKVTRIPWHGVDGNVQGYSTGRGFTVSPVAVYPVKTMMHELAHIVLGHTTETEHAEYVAHRGVFEFEAEATAHLVLKELGALSDDAASVSRGYLQGWLNDAEVSAQSVRRVFKAVNEILTAGRPSVAAVAE